MSYQVLARKYRPQRFEDVIGQEHVTRTLVNAIAAKRIHHAYLFTGARGIGKTTVARLLAKALNCEKGPAPEPCNECPSCAEITAGSSLDVQEIDGASNTGVDDVREIREHVRYMPSSGRYKIYIIDEVHMLSTSAFNALLKTLEEPPPHVVFIFATTEAHKIPATILSRCQRYDFRRIPSPRIAQSLKAIADAEGIAVEDEALALIAREASGSLRDGQSLFDQAIAYGGNAVTAKALEEMLGFLDRRAVFDLVGAIVTRNAATSLAALDEIYQTGADLTQLANAVLEMLRHVLVIRVAGAAAAGTIELSPGEIGQLTSLAEGVGTEEIERMFGLWYAGAEQIARSPLPKMLAEVLVIRLCSVAPVKPVADIMARIDEIVGRAPAMDGKTTQGVSAPRGKEASDAACIADAQARGRAEEATSTGDWDDFMRWVVKERPQVASVLGHGTAVQHTADSVALEFDASLYAEMVMEPDRKAQIDALLMTHFKRAMKFSVSVAGRSGERMTRAEKNRQVTKEALDNPLVKQAAKIFDAKVHDVRTRAKE